MARLGAGKRPSPRGSTLAELRQRVQAGPPYSAAFVRDLRFDSRAGARELYQICLKRRRAADALLECTMELEDQVRAAGFDRVAGVDEAGRGPLAGPIVAAAVVLSGPVPGVNDSKMLTPEERDTLFDMLMGGGHDIATMILSEKEVDAMGLQQANYAVMLGAALRLVPPAAFLLVDGFPIPGCVIPHKHVIKGDRLSQSIAAASIVAKVTRDRMMIELDKQFPGYGFAQHKGYSTAEHLEALSRLGPCSLHRTCFNPVERELQADFDY